VMSQITIEMGYRAPITHGPICEIEGVFLGGTGGGRGGL
jgi:hypothetical protein